MLNESAMKYKWAYEVVNESLIVSSGWYGFESQYYLVNTSE